MIVFTNSRMIRSTAINKAIMDAMSPFIPKDRYPFAIVFITMDQQLLDVNVHPSKWEVRISKEKELQTWLTQVIHQTLLHDQKPKPVPLITQVKEYHEPLSMMENLDQAIISSNQTHHSHQFSSFHVDEKPISSYTSQQSHAHVIAQLHKKYILVSNAEGLLILDQHAAMERVRYEYYLNQYKEDQSTTPKLIPLVIEDARALLLKDELTETLRLINIHLEQLHEHALVIREVPSWLNHVDEEAVILDVVSQLYEKKPNKEEILNRLCASLACHSSVRFNETLSMEEMQQIVDDLFKCNQPFQCPHGRPTMMRITHDALFKEFGR